MGIPLQTLMVLVAWTQERNVTWSPAPAMGRPTSVWLWDLAGTCLRAPESLETGSSGWERYKGWFLHVSRKLSLQNAKTEGLL